MKDIRMGDKSESDKTLYEVQPEVSRVDILQDAIEITSKDRQNTYGKPEKNFEQIAAYWTIYLSNRLGYHVTVAPYDVSIMQSLLKIARTTSSPMHMDNYKDGAAYFAIAAELVSQVANQLTKRKESEND